jgi:integrase
MEDSTTDALGRSLTAANRPGSRKGKAPPNAGRKLPGEVLTPEEMRRLLAAALSPGGRQKPAPADVRNHALLAVLWRCGLRSGEARALMPCDVSLAARTIYVPKSKTAAGLRTVGVDDLAADALERWLRVRAALGVGEASPVFCTVLHGAPGRPLSASFLPEAIKRIARQAGIAKRVHAHGLRHTYAAEVVREGVPLPVISRMLGHADSQITHRYIDHTLSRTEVIEAMQQRGRAEVVPGDNLSLHHALDALFAETLQRGVRDRRRTLGDERHNEAIARLIAAFTVSGAGQQ